MLVFRRYRRMLVRAFLLAFVAGALVAFAFAGGVLLADPLTFAGLVLIAAVICCGVAVVALLGAFAAVWLADRRIRKSGGVRVALAVIGAGLGVAGTVLLLAAFDRSAGAIDWSSVYLSIGPFVAVVAAICAGFMASFVEFPPKLEPSPTPIPDNSTSADLSPSAPRSGP